MAYDAPESTVIGRAHWAGLQRYRSGISIALSWSLYSHDDWCRLCPILLSQPFTRYQNALLLTFLPIIQHTVSFHYYPKSHFYVFIKVLQEPLRVLGKTLTKFQLKSHAFLVLFRFPLR